MAIIRLGPIAGAISGNVGGTSFANTKSGTVVRKRIQRTLQRSTHHDEQSDYWKKTRNFWKLLTDEQREAWRVTALSYKNKNRLGISTRLSGFALYMKFNTEANINRDAHTFAPAFQDPPELVTVDWNAASALVMDVSFGHSFTSTVVVSGPTQRCALYGARTFRTTSIPKPRSYRWILNTSFDAGTVIFTNAWNDNIGTPEVGEFCMLKIVPFTLDGPAGPEQFLTTFAIA